MNPGRNGYALVSGSLVAAVRGSRRRTAFFCPEARPLAAATHIGVLGGTAPMFDASPVSQGSV
jgi:hypothetical protein